ncbi:GNAT family N-acetyltransferase [Flavobacterium sp. IMCC34518]|uniref:GNAT family N-acetyltransferase n=1 Tax=Flavobacterium sp. IMCC34518 TaxID=3003623 RepID=UPI0022AC47E1|nr:GNAT family N-acetyltransferase [Flavobacterium sp. IMCC34518]
MNKQEAFHIAPLETGDTKSLSRLMITNAERFKRYFPKTLSSNLTLEATENYIESKIIEFEIKSGFTFAIKEQETQTIMGLVILKKVDWQTKQAEIAYCIGKEYERKGWVTKAVKAISNYAFNELNLEILQIIAHKTNLASIKVAENNGFVWQRTLVDEFTPTYELSLDMELYEYTNEK